MKPRSVVFDLFGDYVRYAGGEIRMQSLTRLLADFDVAPATARVALSRLHHEGWFDTRRQGKESLYALNDRSWDLLDEGRTRIFDRPFGRWDGRWRMVIYAVPESARPARDRIRRKLAWRGFGPLAPSTYLSPHDRLDDVEKDLSDESSVRFELFTCTSKGRQHDRATAARCWDLETLDRDYRALIAEYRPLVARWRRRELDGPAALIARIRLVHAYRMFPFRDPDLPVELLPTGWPGRAAHELFLEAHERLRPASERYFSEVSGLEVRH